MQGRISASAQEDVQLRRGDRFGPVELPGVGFHICNTLAQAGDAGGSAPFNTYRAFASSEQYHNIYMCIYMKHDPNFDNTNGNTGSKWMWPAGDVTQPSMTYTISSPGWL